MAQEWFLVFIWWVGVGGGSISSFDYRSLGRFGVLDGLY